MLRFSPRLGVIQGLSVCGTAKFTAGREMSKMSGAQIDKESIQVALCRYVFGSVCVCMVLKAGLII